MNSLLPNARKSILRKLYRSCQLKHSITQCLVRFTLPIGIPVTEFILISSMYSVLRLFHTIDHFISTAIGSVGLFAGVMLKFVIDFSVRLTESSRGIARLGFHENSRAKVDQKFFKSCRPLKWTVGTAFTLDKDTFLIIMDTIVISAVIRLLVEF